MEVKATGRVVPWRLMFAFLAASLALMLFLSTAASVLLYMLLPMTFGEAFAAGSCLAAVVMYAAYAPLVRA